jgi:hypothetical protein
VGSISNYFIRLGADMNQYVENNFQNLKTIEFEYETWKLTYKNVQAEGAPIDLLLSIEEINSRIKKLKKTIAVNNNRYLRLGVRTNGVFLILMPS